MADKIAERKRKKADRLVESQKIETEKLLAEQKMAREDLELSQVLSQTFYRVFLHRRRRGISHPHPLPHGCLSSLQSMYAASLMLEGEEKGHGTQICACMRQPFHKNFCKVIECYGFRSKGKYTSKYICT